MTRLDGLPVLIIGTRRFGDSRGWFFESYNRQVWREQGVDLDFVQDNHSYSQRVGTIRGIHFQRPPRAQAKLVRCVQGAIEDWVVDLRAGSPTYGRPASTVLSRDNGLQLFVPVGFGHGFVTLTEDCEVEYRVSDYYAPDHESGIAWDDPDLAIPWTLPREGPNLSAKDSALPRFADLVSPFRYEPE